MKFSKCWLNYRSVNNKFPNEITTITILHKSDIILNAVKEIKIAWKMMFDKEIQLREEKSCTSFLNSILLLRWDEEISKKLNCDRHLNEDGYQIRFQENCIYIVGKNDQGILYGVFDFLRRLQKGESISSLNVIVNPAMNLRMINHWDNMDGSIERGYSGESFFYQDYKIFYNERTEYYARLMASIGINAIVINNVNVHERETYLITDTYLNQLKQYSDLFQSYGIKLFLSVNFAAPMELSDIDSADPLDERVIGWWNQAVKHIYEVIPDFGGFLVKADSEGRPGPFTYHRTHADGANMLARAIAPYQGIIVWRCFVYNCQQDWRDKKTDRARSAYDNFIGLDGTFEDNVVLQIKNGPMDFQVREPVSPLFGGLKKTNQMLEVQIAQEYTGQQKHVCYLIPMWKEVLDFNTYAGGKDCTVSDVVSGNAYHQVNCGMAGVTNTGCDFNWTGHDLSAANLFGYGRLCFQPSLSAEEIAREWIHCTLSNDEEVIDQVEKMLMNSWPTYEKYTSPLGIGWMVTPHYHYGPDVDGYEYDRWGTYHRADRDGLGVDRTVKGTGYAMLYNEPNASMYEKKETCPEELLLFFHYTRYDYKLKNGTTLIQHIYNTHFEGVEEVEKMIQIWEDLKQKIDSDVYDRVLERLKIQLESSKEWRDRINTYFYRKSGVDDTLGRKIYY